MKCRKCNKENIYDAKYCKYCKNKFSNQDREEARNKTLWGKLEKLEKAKEIVTLDVIFGNIIFKIVSLAGLLIVSLYFLLTIGNNLKILESSDYSIRYNKEKEEYYLITENDSINLKLFIPNRLEKLTVKQISEEKIVSTTKINKKKSIKLETANDKAYYLFESNKKTENLKIYVYKVES